MRFIDGRKLTLPGAILFATLIFFATLVTGCYDGGGGYYDNGPGYYGPYYGGYYGGNYYGNGYYRGWDHGHDYNWGRGAFGGYAPGHNAWDSSSRGRASFGGGVGAGHGGGVGAGHGGGFGGGGHGGGGHGGGGHGR